MSEGIMHINFYLSKQNGNKILRTKRHLKEKLNIKTYEEMFLYLCSEYEKQNQTDDDKP